MSLKWPLRKIFAVKLWLSKAGYELVCQNESFYSKTMICSV